MVTAKRDDASKFVKAEHTAFWRNSTYEEPTWVSLVWIVAPLFVAAVLIYVVIG